ncbi:polysaccharide deacetylase family protein [Micromonospora sp. WMMD987]|jgi:peptidoglycan/xylan/chitin deacetylase (PgdA/CDA1 family)|uniref:polysaccharide deacetylase family protein n=1 Tax=Micromonospora TaxID=1873 RepID=UPI00249B9EB5|nr:polysaccharide deacetylase family protein [Micromonospora sp. WMMD987]WFE95285.1 polysaccharide deacetylase family protein [Micromonospora sp. WMMD987]
MHTPTTDPDLSAPEPGRTPAAGRDRAVSRRRILSGGAAALAGAGVALTGEFGYTEATAGSKLPVYGGYAATVHADRRTPPRSSRVDVVWSVDTTRRLIALTFDDGPAPNWTPRVLSILAETDTPATFFMVGRRAREYGRLVTHRLDRHEIGNHTWDHRDLAKMTYEQACVAIGRAHNELTRLCGREPTLLRPPYGHLAGSTLLAANDLGYQVVLWNRQMLESRFTRNPGGLVDYVVDSCDPGTILLAHDTGPVDRLVAIQGLAAMISGLRRRGFEFVTVSDLMAAATPAAAAPAH